MLRVYRSRARSSKSRIRTISRYISWAFCAERVASAVRNPSIVSAIIVLAVGPTIPWAAGRPDHSGPHRPFRGPARHTHPARTEKDITGPRAAPYRRSIQLLFPSPAPFPPCGGEDVRG